MSFTEIKQLLGDKLGVEIIIRRKIGSGVIALPPGFEKKTDEAIIRYLGEGYKGELKLGDRVLYDRYKGETITVAGKEIHFLNSSDVIAVIESEGS